MVLKKKKSLGVANAAYIVPLFRHNQSRIDKLLIILIIRSKMPFQLLAGGQIKLSIESFGNVTKENLIKLLFFNKFHPL